MNISWEPRRGELGSTLDLPVPVAPMMAIRGSSGGLNDAVSRLVPLESIE